LDLRKRGDFAEARELIAPLFASFTEGFDTADLKEAKALAPYLEVAHLAHFTMDVGSR
jgi:hypothetical protein